MSRHALACLSLAALLAVTAPTARACRELVVFPAHLEISPANPPNNYYVVNVLQATSEVIVGRIAESFGGALPVSSRVIFYFAPNEEPHAVCAVPIKAGETRLFRVSIASGRPEISRFNWLNVASSHENYAAYVGDLRSAT